MTALSLMPLRVLKATFLPDFGSLPIYQGHSSDFSLFC